MNALRKRKIKKTINNLIKSKNKIGGRELVIYLNKRINKDEFLFLLNDKSYCKKIISLYTVINSYNCNNIWQNRATTFMNYYINDLFNLPKYLLEKNIFELIRANLSLKNIEEIINYFENRGYKSNLRKYINQLLHYKNKNHYSTICEYHEYIVMQHTEYLNEIEKFYNLNSINKLTNIKKLILYDKINSF